MRSRIDGDERNVVVVGAAAAIAVVIVIVIVVAILEWPRRAGEWKKEMGGGGMAIEWQLREEGVVTMTMIVIMTMTTVAMMAVLVLVLVLVLMAEENDVVGGVSTAASSRCRGYEAHDGCRILRSE